MRRYLLTAILIFSVHFLTAQSAYTRNDGTKISLKDSSAILKKQANAHSLIGTNYCIGLVIADAVVVRNTEVDPERIKEYIIVKQPESFKKYSYLGVNGAVEIKTKQQFLTTTISQVQRQKYARLEGKITYALNGFFVKDTELTLSSESIIETELIKIDTNPLLSSEYFNSTCICIWTMTKAERGNPEFLCSGGRNQQ